LLEFGNVPLTEHYIDYFGWRAHTADARLISAYLARYCYRNIQWQHLYALVVPTTADADATSNRTRVGAKRRMILAGPGELAAYGWGEARGVF